VGLLTIAVDDVSSTNSRSNYAFASTDQSEQESSGYESQEVHGIWFEPTFFMVGKKFKAPCRSTDQMTSVSFDLFANFWDGHCVTLPPKTARQISTGHALRKTWIDSDRPSWYGRIVATPLHDSRGILHGSSLLDPRHSEDIVVTLHNFSNNPFTVCDKDLIGRLVFNSCFVPECWDKEPLHHKFRG
jgi:dUTPase